MPPTTSRRHVLVLAVLAVALVVGASRPSGAPAQHSATIAAGQTVVLAPVADASVPRAGRSRSSARLSAQGGRRTRRAYLRFQVTLPPATTIVRAELRLFTLSQDRGAGVSLRSAGSGRWHELGLSWRRRPALGAVVDRRRGYRRHSWISLDASPAVRSAGDITLALTTTGRSWHGFASREARHGRPRLTIVTAPTPPAQTTATAARWYAADSPWNTPLPADPPIHPDSAAMVSAFPPEVLGPTSSSVPSVWVADSSTPRVDVALNFPTCGAEHFQVPIPAGARLENQHESKFAVLESDTGVEWDFFKMTSPGVKPLSSGPDCPATSSWAATVVQRHDPGWTSDGLGRSVRASSTFEGAGTIRPRDTDSPPGSTWDHALALAYPLTSDGGVHPCMVWPAARCDGEHSGISAIPEGARIQLDPKINCSTWPSMGAREWQRQLCRTLQKYGMIVIDTGGALINEYAGSYDMHPAGYHWPWEADGVANLPADLVPHLRVLDWTRWTGQP
jgi:hypothetical protein